MSAAKLEEEASVGPPGEGAGQPLPLERYAAICALLDIGRRRDEVLEGAKLSTERWTDEQESWLHRMADQARRQRFELQRRFNDIYLDRLGALAAGRAIEVAEGVALDDGRAEAEQAEPAASSKRARVVPKAAPPPSVRAASVPPPPAVSPPPPAPPAPHGDAALPFASASTTAEPPPSRRADQAQGPPVLPFASPARPPAMSPAMAFRASSVHETGDGAPASSAAPALPFQGGRGSERRRPPPPAEPHVLPFANPASQANPAPPSPPQGEPPKKDPLTSTMAFDAVPTGPSLPFAAAAGAMGGRKESAAKADDGVLPFHAIEKASGAKRVAEAAVPPVAPSDDGLAGTMMIDEGLAAAGPRLTLEQFASLTAEIARSPADRAAVERRYGLDAASHDAEKRAWAMKFLDDPSLADDYRTKVETYRAWLERGGS